MPIRNYRPRGPSPPPRRSAARRGYDRRWRQARLSFLLANPLCRACNGAASVVDHVQPHRGDAGLFWDTSNWQALCAACHNRKTGSGA